MSDLVTLEEAQEFLDTDEDLSAAITRASAEIRSRIGPVVIEPTTEVHDGGGEDIFLSRYPVKESTIVVTDTQDQTTFDNYVAYPDEGRLSATYRWGPGRRRWKVKYEAGLVDSVDNVPGDIKKATLLLIAEEVEGQGSGRLQSESIGDYSYTRSSAEEADVEIQRLLAPYRRRDLF